MFWGGGGCCARADPMTVVARGVLTTSGISAGPVGPRSLECSRGTPTACGEAVVDDPGDLSDTSIAADVGPLVGLPEASAARLAGLWNRECSCCPWKESSSSTEEELAAIPLRPLPSPSHPNMPLPAEVVVEGFLPFGDAFSTRLLFWLLPRGLRTESQKETLESPVPPVGEASKAGNEPSEVAAARAMGSLLPLGKMREPHLRQRSRKRSDISTSCTVDFFWWDCS